MPKKPLADNPKCPSCTQHNTQLDCLCGEACAWSECCARLADEAYFRASAIAQSLSHPRRHVTPE